MTEHDCIKDGHVYEHGECRYCKIVIEDQD